MTPPQIYLSHARQDLGDAEEIYRKLSELGFRPWLFEKDVQPGEKWEPRVKQAILNSDLFLPLISENWSRGGYVQKEFAQALAITRKRESDRVFIIPVVIRPVGIPETIQPYLGVLLYEEDGWERLIRSIGKAFAYQQLPPPEPPEELIQAFAVGDARPFVYVGAGLSAPMGLPLWQPLAKRLLEWAEEQGIIREGLLESLHQSLDAGDPDLVADSVVEASRSHDLQERLMSFLRMVFTDQPVSPGPNHRRIRDLRPDGALTTNFDDLLEQTFAGAPVFTHQDTEALLDTLSRRQFFVLKLYGTLERPETVLVAPKQYEDEIVGNLSFSQFMESVFVSRTLLFIGASLEGIEAYLRGIRFRGTLSRQHFALVAVSGTAWKARAESLRRRYQILVVPYTISHDHHEVDHFLNALAARIHERTGHKAAVVRKRGRLQSRIEQVRLEGIGPFDELTMKLDGRWNILLGNNGVGKSNVLRAVAAALCGRDAQPFADRLIKFGQPAGRVILRTEDGKEFVTRMSRTSSIPLVETYPGRLLDLEGWLALGFPALRTVTWRRTRGPQLDEARTRPNPEDVLPLVVGGADPRVDQLKQWIVDIDYRIKDRNNRNRDRYARLLEEFFRVIGGLTGGLKVEFGGVDTTSGQVTLLTDDGPVPLEAVSQGTVSLFGWIGVLMQRLYEVYEEEEHPIQHYALVLIDEIDAHMHPAWQLKLIPLLRESFPEVQFIATTHSPLVVCNIGDGAVCRFERDEVTKVVKANRQTERPAGLGVEGLLTSEFFGLHSQLDDETQRLLDEKVAYTTKKGRLKKEDKERLKILDRKLDEIGLLSTFTDPYYTEFLRALARRRELARFKEPVCSNEERDRRRKLIDEIVAELESGERGVDAVR
jgi:hypothetical protein